MEDDHVDRPGVEERQRLKLTGTNSSIGLIVLIPYAHLGAIQRIVARSQMVLPALMHERPLTGPMLREGAGKPATRSRACGLCPLAKRKRRLGTENSFSNNVRFADLVVMAERLHPIPFRTRP